MSKRVLRLPEVIEKTGIQKSLLYKKISQGQFPKQVRISDKAVGWLSTDVDGWLDQRVSERDEREAKRRAFPEGRLAK